MSGVITALPAGWTAVDRNGNHEYELLATSDEGDVLCRSRCDGRIRWETTSTLYAFPPPRTTVLPVPPGWFIREEWPDCVTVEPILAFHYEFLGSSDTYDDATVTALTPFGPSQPLDQEVWEPTECYRNMGLEDGKVVRGPTMVSIIDADGKPVCQRTVRP